MRLTNVSLVHKFLATVDKCKGSVWLESPQGDKFNLKSPLSQYVAVAKLISEHGDELELFCGDHEDEYKFFEFFGESPEALQGGD